MSLEAGGSVEFLAANHAAEHSLGSVPNVTPWDFLLVSGLFQTGGFFRDYR